MTCYLGAVQKLDLKIQFALVIVDYACGQRALSRIIAYIITCSGISDNCWISIYDIDININYWYIDIFLDW